MIWQALANWQWIPEGILFLPMAPMAVAVVPRLGGLGWMDGWIMVHAQRGEASWPVRLVLLR